MYKILRPTAPIPPGHKPATEKQIKFANWIAKVLKIELPCANSLTIYRNWISNHVDDFRNLIEDAENAVDDWESAEADYYFNEAMRW